MIYDVVLRIGYEYDTSAAGGRHLLRLMPMDLPGTQRLITGFLETSPGPSERFERFDFFKNHLVEVAYSSAHAEFDFELKARVECMARHARLDMSPGLDRLREEIDHYRSLEAWSPHHFMCTSPRVSISPAIAEYARDQIHERMSSADMVQTIGRAIHRDMTFDPDATTVETPLDEAFANRHGVCQDFSHIMIACLRSLGIPAGYTSGFLRTHPPEGQTERLEGADAMHAWVRAWCGYETGWIEYDPTNALMVDRDHILVAYGRDYSDVAPIKGVLKTSGSQKSEQAVDVIAIS